MEPRSRADIPEREPRSAVTAASVLPSGEKASDLTSPPVARRGAPTGVSSRASQSAMPCSLRPTAINRPSGLSLPGWPSNPVVGERPVVRERERPAEPAIAREIPGDRGAVVTHRVERLPVGTEDRLLHEVRVAAQRLEGCRRLDVPASDRLVAVRRHDHLPVRAEEHPARAPCGIAGCRSHGSGTEVDELHAVLDADRHGETVRADGERGREAGLDPPRPRLPATPEIPQRQLTILGRGDEKAIVRRDGKLR